MSQNRGEYNDENITPTGTVEGVGLQLGPLSAQTLVRAS